MRREELAPGTPVVREGEPGDRFYVLLSGMAQVVQQTLGERRVLRPGDTFGEVALAMDMPRTASVHAITPIVVASCDRETFDEFLRPLFAEEEDDYAASARTASESAGQAAAAHSPNGSSVRHAEREAGARDRPRGTCRCARSGRTSRASCARRSSAGCFAVAELEAEPQSFGSIRPKPGRTPTRPGNCTLVASASVSPATTVGSSSSRREEREVVERARERVRRRASELAHDPERPEHGGGEVAGERHLGRSATTSSRAARSRCSSRCAACRAPRAPAPSSGGRPEACASRCRTVDPSGPGRLVEVDRPLLHCDERRERRQELRDGGPRQDEARRRRGSRSSPSGPTTTAAAVAAGHASISPSARTAAILDPCRTAAFRRHAPMEPRVGYSRAVVAGRHVLRLRDGADPARRLRHRRTALTSQARLCIEIIARRARGGGCVARRRRPYADLRRAAASTSTRSARAHGEAFGDIRPATAGLVVHALLDPRWLVEIEADAVLPEPNGTRPGRVGAAMKQIYPAIDHRQGLRGRRQRPRPQVRPGRPVHARRRGGVHAPRRRHARPRPAHRHRPRGHRPGTSSSRGSTLS